MDPFTPKVPLSQAQKETIEDARKRGWIAPHARIPTVQILIVRGFVRSGYIREDANEVIRLTREGIANAKEHLEGDQWEQAYHDLDRVRDINNERRRTRFYLTEHGKAVIL